MAGGVREIPLTRGLVALVDEADFDWLSRYRWSVDSGATPRALANRLDGELIPPTYMHRLIMGEPPGLLVDHANGDTLDNRRCNLRAATVTQNAWNRGPTRENLSGFKGVFWIKGRWQAQIMAHGVRHYLGRHRTREAAARAYDAKARELHGEFARLNFPDREAA